MNSIEVLLDAGSTASLLEGWQTINVQKSVLSPRFMPAAAALNDSEIVVLGGAGVDDDDEIADLGDAIVIDVS